MKPLISIEMNSLIQIVKVFYHAEIFLKMFKVIVKAKYYLLETKMCGMET